MTSINNKVRDELDHLIRDELGMVDARAKALSDSYWTEAEQEVAREFGYGDVLIQTECLRAQIAGLQTELADLEGRVVEKARKATIEDYHDCGIEVSSDRYGDVYSCPRVFGREIKTVWDTKVLKHLNETLSFFKVYSNLQHLHHSVKRELLLAGTFEEARAVYQRFHVKLTEALGDDMPKLLSQVDSIPALREYREPKGGE